MGLKSTSPARAEWQSRAEILREHADQQELTRLLGLKSELKEIKREYYARKFDSEQPRVQAGDPRGGQWTGGAQSDVQSIIDRVKRLNLAAGPDAYRKCLNECYRLLERPRSPGSDRNTWDFHKCMNACLQRNP